MTETGAAEQVDGRRTSNDLVERYLHALTTADFGDYPLAEHVVFLGPRMGPVEGSDSVRPVLERVARLFQRFRIIEHGRFVGADEAVLFVEVLLPDGRGFTIADHLLFSGGETVRVRPYFDAGLLEDLGLAPAVAELGSRACL